MQTSWEYGPVGRLRIRCADEAGTRGFERIGCAFADTSFFDLFEGFDRQQGDPGAALIIATMTVSDHAARAARIDPPWALRSE